MATAAASPAPISGVSASMWANQPSTPRAGWTKGSESGPGTRGAARGGSRGRAPRGGRGGRGGGRTTNDKGTEAATKADIKKEKETPDSSKEHSPPAAPKHVTPPPPITPSISSQTNTTIKGSARPKPPRKNSEQKGANKVPSLGVDTLNVPPSNASSSPSVSPHTPHRRRKSQAQKTVLPPPQLPPPPITCPLPLNKHLPTEQTTAPVEKPAAPPVPAPAPARDVPPHMVPQDPPAPTDIAHNIDALVERVRAVAMDRPHTPGNHSHFDWAGDDEDDSLPDLDDWGVTSSLSTTGPITEPNDSEKVSVSVISPILQDTLKPLPSIIDIDISTTIKIEEPHEPSVGPQDAKDATPRSTAGKDVTSSKAAAQPSKPDMEAEQPASPGPDRGLHASIHAIPSSQSAPSHLNPRRVPTAPRGGFNPTHNRAHTLGRFKPDSHLNADQPKRNESISHGRNHSTPPTGPGTATAHARAHHTRPVISGDAISRLARSLGGAAAPRREREAAAVAATGSD
ncbi:hypothetical protein BDW22DRAFT_1417251 [Trametopsis cervina]|nr:hypothetical protein BDW22DRAFT_1417251 [Trametopsis cervina]